MKARSLMLAVATLLAAGLSAVAQIEPSRTTPRPADAQDLRWRTAGSGSGDSRGSRDFRTENRDLQRTARAETPPDNKILPIEPLRPVTREPRARIARVTGGDGTLPNTAGQVWREYDISPYTLRVTSTQRPEQAIIDWLLRETGFETWHSELVTVLSADRRTLRVYHTQEVQDVVGDLVDRFVNTQAETHAIGLRVITVDKPNWRARAQAMLQPIPVESQGAQAWLVQKEDAAQLLADLRKRSDCREHSAPHLLVNNGQSVAVVSTRPRNFIHSVVMRPEAWPGYESQMGQFEEGFTFELSPLLSLDGQTLDAVMKCTVDQIEKLHPVMIEAHTPVAPRQRTRIEVPQTSQSRLHERFRWPTDRVLLVSLGMVPTPLPKDPNPIMPVLSSPPRADLLIFVDSRGNLGPSTSVPRNTRQDPQNHHGRY